MYACHTKTSRTTAGPHTVVSTSSVPHHVVYVHAAVVRPRVDEPLSGGVRRREVAADEGLQHLVAAVGHEGAVVGVAHRAGVTRVIHPAVVPLVLGDAQARETERGKGEGEGGEGEVREQRE